jgi:hypothetical protein
MPSASHASDSAPKADRPSGRGGSGRRNFISGMAGMAGAVGVLAVAHCAEAGDASFMNNAPDPLLANNELPTFRFPHEKSEGGTQRGGIAEEATVKRLPISKELAGVSMAARARRDAGTPLASHRCRVGVRGQPPGSHHGGRSGGTFRNK